MVIVIVAESPRLRWLLETEVSDGNGGKIAIHRKSKVNLLPTYEDHRRDFGDGPFIVSDMSEWPCGRIMVYIDTPKCKGIGVYADEIMAVTQ